MGPAEKNIQVWEGTIQLNGLVANHPESIDQIGLATFQKESWHCDCVMDRTRGSTIRCFNKNGNVANSSDHAPFGKTGR